MSKDLSKKAEEVIRVIDENGRVTGDSPLEEREEEFDFEASEQGLTDEEIEQVKESPWFAGWFGG